MGASLLALAKSIYYMIQLTYPTAKKSSISEFRFLETVTLKVRLNWRV